jgi:hypothetical protein
MADIRDPLPHALALSFGIPAFVWVIDASSRLGGLATGTVAVTVWDRPHSPCE